MLRVAPDDVLKKVYRMIAAEIHPDKGGAPEAMIVLNTAWSEIKKERKL
jgi:DnaJ-class molecular chaperone